jgi:hypothetical protein
LLVVVHVDADAEIQPLEEAFEVVAEVDLTELLLVDGVLGLGDAADLCAEEAGTVRLGENGRFRLKARFCGRGADPLRAVARRIVSV